MLFEALGPLEIRHDRGSFTPSAAKPRVVLALLLINANHAVSIDALIEEVWGERPPASSANTLQTYIYKLRKVLADLERDNEDGPRLATLAGGYALHVAEDMFDVAVFGSLVDRGTRALEGGRAAESASLLRRALGMWHGNALSGVQLGSRLGSYATYLDERRLRTIEQYNEAQLVQGDAASLIPSLKDLAHTYPNHDAFQRQLMLALSRSGRRAEALDHFHLIRSRTTEELGLDPSPQLKEMHEAILNGRPGVVDERRHATELSLPKPAQLLADCARFRGYREQLEQARAALTVPVSDRQVPPVIRVSGLPGAGRKTFATHLAHLVKQSYPEGQFFQEVDRVGASASLEGFLHAAGIPGSRIPASVSDRAAMFRSWTANRQVLVVLHNASRDDDVESLLPAGPGCGSIVTCVSASNPLLVTQEIQLQGLDLQSALDLLRDFTGASEMTSVAKTVVNQCGRMPGLIAEIGSLLANKPGYDLSVVSRLLAEDSWELWRRCGGLGRLISRIRETARALDEDELMILTYLCATSQHTLPDLADALSMSTLAAASAVERLLRLGLLVERPVRVGERPVRPLPARSSEPVYEVARLVKQYLHPSATRSAKRSQLRVL